MANLQPTYGEYLAPAIVGMRANMEPARVITRVCNVLAGMPFGVVAVRASGDDDAAQNVASGGGYLGVVGIDHGVRPGITASPDMFVYQDLMHIYTMGVIWVKAQAAVTPGQQAYYDGNGYLTSVSGAGLATGSIAFTVNPTAGQTISFSGSTVTFVASGATGLQVNIGANLAATLTSLLAFLTASADTNLVTATYSLSGTTLLIQAVTGGTAGNSKALATTVTGATTSGATLTGGTAANTIIPNAQFDSTAAAQGLVKLRLRA